MHEVKSVFPEPDVTDADVAARLSSPWLRFTAHAALLFKDHHVLRAAFSNRHQAGPDMWRTNQPSPKQLERWAAAGLKTVVNLRGVSPKAFHTLERDACLRLGLRLITFRVKSREAPPRELPRLAAELFETIEYPALMHCKSGADRVGLMGVMFRALKLGEPVETAIEQLSSKYLHVKAGKTGILDAYFQAYLAEGAPAGLSLIDWSQTRYDPQALQAGFKPAALGDFLVDTVLRRE